jgi:hypothetical protein
MASRSYPYPASTGGKAAQSKGGKATRVPQTHQAEASSEFMAQVLGIKRVMPANPSSSQPAKKRKVVEVSQVENEEDEEDEVAAAAAQAALAGKDTFLFASENGCNSSTWNNHLTLVSHFKDGHSLTTSGIETSKPKQVRKKKGEEPEEKRLKRFRQKAPLTYLERLGRVKAQRMFLVDRNRTTSEDGTHEEEIFDLVGSTGNIYQITISKVPKCTCPDAGKGNQCKHIIYVCAPLSLLGRYGN